MKARQVKRLARTGLSISLLVVIGAGFSNISSAIDKSDVAISSSESKYVQVVVTPGESLWSIAAPVLPSFSSPDNRVRGDSNTCSIEN